jgi:hypothetical protein
MKTSFPLTLALITASLIVTRIQAQEIATAQPGNVILHIADIGIGGWNGVKIGGDYVLTAKTATQTKRGKLPQTVLKNTHLTLNYSLFYRRLNQANSMVTIGYQFQKTRQSGWFTSIEPMFGVRRAFGASTENSNWPGLFSGTSNRRLVSGVSFGVGRDFSIAKRPLPVSVYSKFSVYGSVPRFRVFSATSMVEIGVSYNMGSIFDRKKK